MDSASADTRRNLRVLKSSFRIQMLDRPRLGDSRRGRTQTFSNAHSRWGESPSSQSLFTENVESRRAGCWTLLGWVWIAVVSAGAGDRKRKQPLQTECEPNHCLFLSPIPLRPSFHAQVPLRPPFNTHLQEEKVARRCPSPCPNGDGDARFVTETTRA